MSNYQFVSSSQTWGGGATYQYSTAGLPNLYVVSGSKEIADLFVAQINADYTKVQSLRDILGQHAAMTSGIQILLVQGSGTISGEFGFGAADMNGLSGVANWFHTSKDADGDPIYAANSTLPYGVSLTLNLDNATTGGTPSAASIQFQKLVQVTVHELWHPFAGDHLWEKAANPVDRFALSVNDITGDTSYARDFETFAQQGRIGFALDTVTVGNTAWVGQIVLAGTPAAQNKSVGTIVGAGTDDEIMVVDQATFSKVLGNIIFKQHVKNRAAAIEAQKRGDGKAVEELTSPKRPYYLLEGAPGGGVTKVSLSAKGAAQMGSIIGSTLGGYLAGGDKLKGVAFSSILGAIGAQIGAAIATGASLESVMSSANMTAFGADAWNRLQSAAVGSVSSLLTMELGQALGLQGFGAELFNTAGSSFTNKALTNIIEKGPSKIFDGLNSKELFKSGGAGTLMANAIGSFIGAKLGAMVVQPQTQAAVALSSIGSAVGAWAMTTTTLTVTSAGATSTAGAFIIGQLGLGNSWLALNVVAPGIGAFVGFVLGALIGNLFGRKKPKIPSANAETVLQVPYAKYELGTVTVVNNGNRSLVTSMATAARDTLNGLINTIAYTNTTAYVSNLNGVGTTQIYGHTSSQIWVKINGVQTNFASADAAVEYGTLTAIRNTKIVGGDIFAKRVIVRSPATDLTSLLGDLQVVNDYRFYANNRGVVNALIGGAFASLTQWEKDFYDHPPHKALIDKARAQGLAALTSDERSFYDAYKPSIDKIIAALENQTQASPWIITLQRALELGLDKFTTSDFYGGLRGFLDSFDLHGQGVAYENANFQWNGGGDFIVSVAGGTAGLFTILPTASADGRTVTINGLDKIGYTWVNADAATSGNDYMEYRWNGGGVVLDDNHAVYVEDGYYRWDGWDSYEWIDTSYWTSGDGGDDIFIGSQYGDQLYGRSGWDWLDGQAGNDYIDGGDGNDTLIGRDGEDTLIGGAGDDYLSGGGGTDSMDGGVGNDILADGAGSEVLQGGEGDDVFLIAEDATFNWFWGGYGDPNSDPYGQDTISAERLTFGVAFDLDYRPPEWNGNPDATAGNPITRAAIVTNAVTGAWVTSEGLLSIENATGSDYADRLYGTTGDNVLKGLDGADQLWGRDGNDTIEGGVGADTMDGGGGYDWLSYARSSTGVYVDLSTGKAIGGDADGDVFSGFEAVRGSRAADQLKGYDGGDNWLEGGAGDDWLVATTGNDVFVGGEGRDFVDYSVGTSGVTLNLGAANGAATGYGSAGLAAGHAYIGVEGVVGSAYGDNLSAGDGDHTFIGGAGNDVLQGGAGADTYVINRGDGADTVYEDNTGWNVISFGSNVKFSDIWGGTAGGSSGWLDLGIRGDAQVRVVSNFGAYPTAGNNKVKSIDMGGASQLDIGAITFGVASNDASTTLVGSRDTADLILAMNGDDIVWGAASNHVESNGNVVVGGLGNDQIHTSNGDDQFGYDRGEGLDIIWDTGGEDTLALGASVAAEDVIYQVVGNDLYIGARNLSNTALTASQVADRVQIVGGGVKYVTMDGYSNTVLYESFNTVEYVLAGGTSIDLRKLDIAWTQSITYNYDYAYPIALDLDGDGLDLSTVESSSVVVKTAGGGISQIGWVGPTDGFLAVDRNGDGAINQLSELSFVQDKPGATSDLEGLRTWDTNGDGLLDKNDKDFSKILLFVDANQNGRSTAKELRTLEQAGIAAINLGGLATGQTRDQTTESFVQNTISFIWADGRTGEGYDVALARRVLGSNGLDGGAYQAEWGAADEDGELGQLTNDAKTAAQAARIKVKKALLDQLGASYGEVKAAAQLDFSDHDRVDATIAARWTKMSASEKASWLTGQQPEGKVRLISTQQALANDLNAAAKARQDVVDQGYAQAARSVSVTGLGQPGGRGASAADASGLGVSFGSQGLGLSLAGGEPLDAGSAYGGSSQSASAWWRQEAGSDLLGGGSLAARLAAMDAGPGQGSGLAASGALDASLVQNQALLRQAMAGFGGQAGGGAAVWSRDGASRETPLAASAGLKATQSLLTA